LLANQIIFSCGTFLNKYIVTQIQHFSGSAFHAEFVLLARTQGIGESGSTLEGNRTLTKRARRPTWEPRSP
jgi:hypothetical protein